MMWAGESLLSYGRVIDPADARKALTAVTTEAVANAARECFTHQNLAAAFVGKTKNPTAIEAILKNW
jgi:predicted Zn-dependent peptidase